MVLIAIALLGFAALLGLYLLSFVLQSKETPKGIAFIHGPLAFLGVIFLIIYASLYQRTLFSAVIIFLLAAIGGLILILRDLGGKSVPKWMALLHGSFAILGFLLLLYLVFA